MNINMTAPKLSGASITFTAVLVAFTGALPAAQTALGQNIKVVNKNPDFGFKLTSAKLNGDGTCAKIGFTKVVLDDSGKLEFHSANQGVLTRKNFVQEFGRNGAESMTCNLVVSYETDGNTKITPTKGRVMGSASIAPGHKVALSSRIATSGKTNPAESQYESPSAPMRVNVDLSSVPIDKLGGAIPCGTKDKLAMRLSVTLKGNSSDARGSEIRLGAGEEYENGQRLFSTFGFTSSGC